MPNNPKYTIICVGIATLFIGLWGELFTAAPTIIKIIYSSCIYGSIVLLPISYIRKNDFGIWCNGLLIIILADIVLQICMTIYNTDPDMYIHGNKWLTLFLNEYTIFSLIPPLFTYLAARANNLSAIYKYLILFILLSLVLAPIQTNSIAFLPIFCIAFFPYISTKHKILLLITIIISILTAISRVRMLMIVNLFSFIAIFLVYLTKSKWVCIIFTILCITIPFITFVPILSLAKGELSFFQRIMEYLAEKNIIDDTNDTRTLLYLEIAEDIEANNSWIFGKGAYCHYYSRYFFYNQGDDPTRTLVEVPFLFMLLKGGIVNIVIYYSLLLTAIIKGLFLGKNRFVLMSSILIVGWFFNSFVGDINGCRFYHLGFFFLVGCCLSNKILSYSDAEIGLLINEQFEKFHILKNIILIKLLFKLKSK